MLLTRSSPVNGITSLTFEREKWYAFSEVSLELPDGRDPGKKYSWPKQAFTKDQRYSLDIGQDDASKAKLNDRQAGEPANLFETWGEISAANLSTLGNWTITDIVVSGDKVEKFTVNYSGSVVTDPAKSEPPITLGSDGSLL